MYLSGGGKVLQSTSSIQGRGNDVLTRSYRRNGKFAERLKVNALASPAEALTLPEYVVPVELAGRARYL